jgi:hypothetical protein
MSDEMPCSLQSHVKNGKFSLTSTGSRSMKENSPQLARQFRNYCLLLASGMLSLLLTACAGTENVKKHPVEERAQQRWDALLSQDFDTAYSLYSPGYRSANSRVDFEISQRTRKVAMLAAQVESSDCEDEACTVSSMVQYQVGSPVPGVSKWESASTVQERWVRTDGKWWYVPEE